MVALLFVAFSPSSASGSLRGSGDGGVSKASLGSGHGACSCIEKSFCYWLNVRRAESANNGGVSERPLKQNSMSSIDLRKGRFEVHPL